MLNKLIRLFNSKPIISILIPVYNTPSEILKKCLDSVLKQSYQKWELCIVDDGSTRSDVRAILKNYSQKDSRICLKFSHSNGGIAATINKAAGMAVGKYIGVLDHDDELEPSALLEYAHLIEKHPDADLIYCDEDKIDESGNHCDLWFKSDWNPDLSLSFNYVMHFAVYRRSLFRKVKGVRKKYEGSQDYDLLLRVTEITKRIYHIPKILYHWRMGSGSIASAVEAQQAKPYVFVHGLAALNDALAQRGIEGTAEDAPDAWKGVYRVKRNIVKPLSCSIVVCFYGDHIALSRLLNSIANHVPMESYDLLICMHSSRTINKNDFPERVRWIEYNDLRPIPRVFNMGAQNAPGEVLWFLDETMELTSAESYTCLLEHVQRKEVGAVGGKIYYSNGLIEHGGIILGPFHLLGYAHRATSDNPGYAGLKNMICNYSAVMGLGMMTMRSLFTSVGGFDKGYETAYWDVDYCLRLGNIGYQITYTPYAKFRHHIPVKPIHEMIVEPDAAYFRKRWQSMIDYDPYFNPNFTRDLEDFSFKIKL